MTGRGGRDALHRYPALGFLAIAALLAMMLPTALRVPLSSPSSTAEVAPLPGKSQQAGALSQLNGASSNGLGAGSGTGTAASGGVGESIHQPGQPPAHVKKCVGPKNARRQTDDPLSPACVPFFNGDNGGATAPGVTKDEIVVVVYYSPDMTQTVTFTDWGTQTDTTGNATDENMYGQAIAHFFNDRYETYDRTVHFWGATGHDGAQFGSNGYQPEALRNAVSTIASVKHPFAIVPVISYGNDIVADAASKHGILTASNSGYSLDFFRQHAPLAYSYLPALDEEAALTADWVCTKLAGRPPRRGNGDPLATRRKFGILYADRSVEPQYRDMASMLQRELGDRCRANVAPSEPATNDGNVAQCQENNSIAMTHLKQANVTTVIVLSNDALCFTNYTSAYSPEWVIPGSFGSSAADRNATARAYGAQWDNAMGITFDVRRARQAQQTWFAAYQEGCPTCPVYAGNGDFVRLYEAESMLLYGIQAAGPHLTVQSFDKGLHAIPSHRSPDPNTPAAYFTPNGYAFVHDAMEIWWDRTGTDAASGKPGCYRLPGDGVRHRVGEWPSGEDELFQTSPAQPCQGDFG